MSFIKESLTQDEKIEKQFKIHWTQYLKPIILIILTPTLYVPIIPAIYFLVKLKTFEQGITNKRIIVKDGVISRESQEIFFKKIETVNIQQSILGRLFNYGTISITGTGNAYISIKYIPDPIKEKVRILEVINKNKKKKKSK